MKSMETALEEGRALLKKVAQLEQEVKVSMEREAILKGRIEQLDAELETIKAQSRHDLQWAVEVTKQLHNVGMFVSDALHQARNEIKAHQGNGQSLQKAYDAVESALGLTREPGHVAVQHQGER